MLFFWCLFLSLVFFLEEEVKADSPMAYNVTIEGVEKRDLHKLLEDVSDTVKLREKPPASRGLLKRRVQKDIPKLITALKSKGFYAAQVKVVIDEEEEPPRVIFTIHTGPPYLLDAVEIRIYGDQDADEITIPDIEQLGLKVGGIAESKPILEARNILIIWLKSRGYPFPEIKRPKLMVNHDGLSVVANILVEPGPRAGFGETTITGLESVEEVFVRKLVPWQEGEPYDADLFKTMRKRLLNTGLFSVVKIIEEKKLDDKGNLPIAIELRERKHRSVSAGLNYWTDEGLGAKASWEHRNLFDQAERFRITGVLSGFTKAVEGSFRKSMFLRDDQNLQLGLRIALDEPDAYTSRNIIASAIVERTLREKMIVGGGLAFKQSQVEQLITDNEFSLLSLPMSFAWDRSDDLLDPRRGNRLRFNLETFADISKTNLTFTKGGVTLRQYVPIFKKPHSVLAGRVTAGTIVGAERNEIPADERLYAGGGGSIRGYFYQSVGPLIGATPIGGRSVLDLSLELRFKVTDRLGLVGFVDGGTAFEGTHFDTDEDILYGAGGGVRYYTPIGPLRLDVGFPLDRREGIDDAFQVYLSIGQAF